MLNEKEKEEMHKLSIKQIEYIMSLPKPIQELIAKNIYIGKKDMEKLEKVKKKRDLNESL